MESNDNDNDNNILNALIFRTLSIYVIYNNSFKSILELSLISKSSFKSFQNLLISHPLNKQLFIIPTITQLIKYINHNNHNDINDENSSYKYKLIQYKDIDEIRFFIMDEIYEMDELHLELSKIGTGENDKLTFAQLVQNNKRNNKTKRFKYKENDDVAHSKSYQYQENNEDDGDDNEEDEEDDEKLSSWYEGRIKKLENAYFNLKRIKSFLNFKCTHLKKVIIVDALRPCKIIPFDFTFNGFYQVKKLRIFNDGVDLPISNAREKSETTIWDINEKPFFILCLHIPHIYDF